MSERDFWLAVRQSLLLFVSAIEKRYKIGKHADGVIQEVGATDTLTYNP